MESVIEASSGREMDRRKAQDNPPAPHRVRSTPGQKARQPQGAKIAGGARREARNDKAAQGGAALSSFQRFAPEWCGREDSNLHGVTH
jgi:hypothetical protein